MSIERDFIKFNKLKKELKDNDDARNEMMKKFIAPFDERHKAIQDKIYSIERKMRNDMRRKIQRSQQSMELLPTIQEALDINFSEKERREKLICDLFDFENFEVDILTSLPKNKWQEIEDWILNRKDLVDCMKIVESLEE